MNQGFSLEIIKKSVQLLLRALEYVCEEEEGTKEERERVLAGLMAYDVLLSGSWICTLLKFACACAESVTGFLRTGFRSVTIS